MAMALLRGLFLLSLIALSHSSHPQTHVAGSDLSTPSSAALDALQKQLGYEFQSLDLLRRAVTHASYSRDNGRALALLGLSAVEAAAAIRLLRRDPDASAAAVNRRVKEAASVEACYAAGARLGLPSLVRVGPKTNVSSPAVVCGAFRALFGAVAIDAGSVDAAGEVFWRVYGGRSTAVSAAAI